MERTRGKGEKIRRFCRRAWNEISLLFLSSVPIKEPSDIFDSRLSLPPVESVNEISLKSAIVRSLRSIGKEKPIVFLVLENNERLEREREGEREGGRACFVSLAGKERG